MPTDVDTMIGAHTLEAEIRKAIVRLRVDREILGDVEVRVLEDHLMHQVSVQFTKRFAANAESRQSETISVPLTWRDHWLEEHGGGWLLRLFRRSAWGRRVTQVRTRQIEHTTTVYRACPHIAGLPQDRHLRWLSLDDRVLP